MLYHFYRSVHPIILRKEACTAPVHFYRTRSHVDHTGRVASMFRCVGLQIEPPGAGTIVTDVAVGENAGLRTRAGLRVLQGSAQGHGSTVRGAAGDVVDDVIVPGRDRAGTAPVYFRRAILVDHTGGITEGIGREGIEIYPPGAGIWIVVGILGEIAFPGTGAVAGKCIGLLTGHIHGLRTLEHTVPQGIRDTGRCFAGVSIGALESGNATAFAERFAHQGTDRVRITLVIQPATVRTFIPVPSPLLTAQGEILGKGLTSRNLTLTGVAFQYRVSGVDTLFKTGNICHRAGPGPTGLVGVVALGLLLLQAPRTEGKHATEGRED
jgi:hypothetical protein